MSAPDRYGRISSPHLERFERRLRFIQSAKPSEQPYADRDGRWGLTDIANDAMLAIIEYEAALAVKPPHPKGHRQWIGEKR